MIEISEITITMHFLERYVYRFNDNKLENIFNRIKRLRKPTKQQFNRIKRCSNRTSRQFFLIDGDLVVVFKNNTLLTCWRIK